MHWLSAKLLSARSSFKTIKTRQDEKNATKYEKRAELPLELNREFVALAPHVDEKLSHAYGRSHKELKHRTVGQMVDAMAKSEPHALAVVVYDEGIRRSFEELRSDIYKLVYGMVYRLGVKRGDKIAVYSYNNYQFLLVQLASQMLGCVISPLNPSYKAHEFTYALDKSDAKVLFTPGKDSRQSAQNNHHAVVCDKSVGQLRADGHLEHLTHIVLLDGTMSEVELSLEDVHICHWREIFSDSFDDNVVRQMIDSVTADDLYGIYYTSGTTGRPKGAAISQFNAINNATLSIERIFSERAPNFGPITPNVCIPLPLFHVFAGILGLVLPFVNGGSIVVTGLRYSIENIVKSILEYKCNSIFLTPTILKDLIAYVERNKITDFPLRTILIGGDNVLPELVQKTHKILPNLEELRIAYGSSENGVVISAQTSQEALETRSLTVGAPLDFTEIRIADTRTGETTLLGRPGEVQTRGFNTMIGYYKDVEKTNEVITPARWYKSGDLGILNKNGSLQLVGRIKDLIIKGGENVYPAEIEAVLHAYELIEDAHVFGVPDERYGEEICTWIKLDKTKCDRMTEEELKVDIRDYCKQKLAYFKVPKYVMFVEEFPLTPLKKIKKFEMRAKATELLNL